jgi:parallel beta-helix repeat protein
MHPIRNLTFSCLALVVLIALSGQVFAAGSNSTVGLCAGPGIHYTTIQAAVNAASVAGTVKVCPGTYPEQVLINKNLTLIGIGPTASVVVPPIGGLVMNGTDLADFPVPYVAAQILVQNANVTVSHLTVDGNGNGLDGCNGSVNLLGIYYENASGTITDSVVRNQITATNVGCGLGFGIYVASNTGTPKVTISSNSVRNYGKNGILATGVGPGIPGPIVSVTGNTVVGLGATTLIAGNGIQLSLLAAGTITSNYVVDNVYLNPPCGGAGEPTCWGSSGILLYASPGVTVSGNTVESTQLGIVPVTDPAYGTGDGTIIQSNHIGGTQNYDAIDLCSNSNTVKSNVIYGSSQDGIHADDSCGGTGNNNTVTGNTINEACAGILLGTGAGTTTTGNTFLNVSNTTLAGDVCPLPVAPAGAIEMGAMATSGALAKHPSFRPSH